jgi:hypothetical protein
LIQVGSKRAGVRGQGERIKDQSFVSDISLNGIRGKFKVSLLLGERFRERFSRYREKSDE